MCKLTSKIRVGNALCATGSGGAIVSSTPMAAAAAQKSTAIFGLGWNELGVAVGIIVGLAGLAFGQYWAWRKHKLDKALIDAQVEALKKG